MRSLAALPLRTPRRVATALCLLVAAWLPLSASALPDVPALLDGRKVAANAGDLDSLVRQRQIRAAVPWSRTDYFIEKGHPRGMAWESARAFEDWLNKRLGRTLRRVHVVVIPCARGELAEMLAAGRADIAIAGLTVTPELAQHIDFSLPVYDDMREVVVSRRASPLLHDRDGLAGQVFFVRASSSYWNSLQAISGGLVLAGLPPITVRTADEHLADEDILELVDAGVIERTVMDDYKARLWADVLPGIRLEPVTVREHAALAWGLRKGTPRLKATVDEFVRAHRVGTAFGNVLAARYYGSAGRLRQPLSAGELARFDAVAGHFRRYAARYGFDALLVTAQGFQESGLDQAARSREGAVGVMQVLPRIGRAMAVGDIRQTEANIHAGIKYLRSLADDSFNDPAMDDYNRTLFAFAAYNAGPAKIRKMQRIAKSRGLDPNKWFDHVERVTGERIGGEPVRYVANIRKYYIAYRVLEDERRERERAREAVTEGR